MTTSTAELLDAATGGDQAAWNALVAQYNSLVWSIARGYRLADADAADAVQMTWLRLVENLGRINDPDRLAGWLATTARRECLQLLRKGARERPTIDDQTALQIADPDPPLDAAMLRGERDSVLWQAFTAIGEKCQRLLRVLMATPPPSYADASLALDMPVGSIGPARQRCLRDLRRIVLADESLAADLREEMP
jgi:RNA polymerase sigma factor (sigma-70 family)